MKSKRTEEIKNELEAIRADNGGILEAAHVVEFARDESTALNKCFCWDDTAAAMAYRLQQAAEVIRVTVTVIDVEGQPSEVRAYVSLTSDRKADGGYRALVEVIDDDELCRQMLADALAELISFKRKYSVLKKIASGVQMLDVVSKAIELARPANDATTGAKAAS
jgi:hypothetical protein